MVAPVPGIHAEVAAFPARSLLLWRWLRTLSHPLRRLLLHRCGCCRPVGRPDIADEHMIGGSCGTHGLSRPLLGRLPHLPDRCFELGNRPLRRLEPADLECELTRGSRHHLRQCVSLLLVGQGVLLLGCEERSLGRLTQFAAPSLVRQKPFPDLGEDIGCHILRIQEALRVVAVLDLDVDDAPRDGLVVRRHLALQLAHGIGVARRTRVMELEPLAQIREEVVERDLEEVDVPRRALFLHNREPRAHRWRDRSVRRR